MHAVDIWNFDLFNNYENVIDNVYGIYRTVQLTGFIRIRQLIPSLGTSFINMNTLIIEVSSLFWINYVDTKGECCAEFEIYPCQSACSYFVHLLGEPSKLRPRRAPQSRFDRQSSIIATSKRSFQAVRFNY